MWPYRLRVGDCYKATQKEKRALRPASLSVHYFTPLPQVLGGYLALPFLTLVLLFALPLKSTPVSRLLRLRDIPFASLTMGATSVREAEFSLLPGVRPSRRDAEFSLLPGPPTSAPTVAPTDPPALADVPPALEPAEAVPLVEPPGSAAVPEAVPVVCEAGVDWLAVASVFSSTVLWPPRTDTPDWTLVFALGLTVWTGLLMVWAIAAVLSAAKTAALTMLVAKCLGVITFSYFNTARRVVQVSCLFLLNTI
jgi:hypothetical protein